MGTVIGITGTPGTGKKSVAPLVGEALGIPSVSLPNVSHSGTRELVIDTAKAMLELSREPPGRVVAYGHLIPYVLPRSLVSRVFVLRCDPAVLKGRLSRRGYSAIKIRENVEAELIGVLAYDAYRAFGRPRTVELDTTAGSPTSTAEAVVGLLGKKVPSGRRIDWTLRYPSARALMSLLGSG